MATTAAAGGGAQPASGQQHRSDPTFQLARTFVATALKGRKVGFKTDPASMRWYHLYYSRAFRNALTVTAVFHMALILVEPVSTIATGAASSPFSFDTRPLEAVILFFYLAEIALKVRWGSWRRFLRSWGRMELACTVLFAIDLAIPGGLEGRGYQFTRALRPFFVVTKRKHVRFIFTGILHSIPKMAPVLVLLVMVLAAFALLASMSMTPQIGGAFAGLATNATDVPPYCSVFSRGRCEDFFTDFWPGLYHLSVLVARASWPVAMLPFYKRSEWAVLFFIAFLMVAHFFFWRLLLAVSFASFAEHCREQYVTQQRRSRAAYKAAFTLLAHDGLLDAETFRQLAGSVRKQCTPQIADVIFNAVGGGRTGFIDATAFVAGCSLFDVELEKVRHPSAAAAGAHRLPLAALCCPRAARTQHLLAAINNTPASSSSSPPPRLPLGEALRMACARVASNARLALAMDVLIIGIAIAELVLTSAPSASPTAYESLQLGVSVFVLSVFALEMSAKVAGFGFRGFWKDGFNRLDVVVVALAIVSFSFLPSDATSSASTRVRVLLFLRLARAMRLLSRLPAVMIVLRTVGHITPLMWRIIIVLGVCMYSLGVIGMELYTGVLSPSDPEVAASSYGVNGQWALNFDTFTRAFTSQFAILVTTQSPIIVEGLMAATRSWGPAVFYFTSYTILVVIVSNILIALLLQSYGIISAQQRARQQRYVEIWEHLLAKAQLDLHLMDAAAFPQPFMYRFKKRNAFLAVNESLFGEVLALDFEVDASEASHPGLRAPPRGRKAAPAAPSSHAGPRSFTASVADAIFGAAFLSGAHLRAGAGADTVSGVTSLRVHTATAPPFAALGAGAGWEADGGSRCGDAAAAGPSTSKSVDNTGAPSASGGSAAATVSTEEPASDTAPPPPLLGLQEIDIEAEDDDAGGATSSGGRSDPLRSPLPSRGGASSNPAASPHPALRPRSLLLAPGSDAGTAKKPLAVATTADAPATLAASTPLVPPSEVATVRRGLTEFIRSALVPPDDWDFFTNGPWLPVPLARPAVTSSSSSAAVPPKALSDAAVPLLADTAAAPASAAAAPTTAVGDADAPAAASAPAPAAASAAVADVGPTGGERVRRLRRIALLAAELAAEREALRRLEREAEAAAAASAVYVPPSLATGGGGSGGDGSGTSVARPCGAPSTRAAAMSMRLPSRGASAAAGPLGAPFSSTVALPADREPVGPRKRSATAAGVHEAGAPAAFARRGGGAASGKDTLTHTEFGSLVEGDDGEAAPTAPLAGTSLRTGGGGGGVLSSALRRVSVAFGSYRGGGGAGLLAGGDGYPLLSATPVTTPGVRLGSHLRVTGEDDDEDGGSGAAAPAAAAGAGVRQRGRTRSIGGLGIAGDGEGGGLAPSATTSAAATPLLRPRQPTVVLEEGFTFLDE